MQGFDSPYPYSRAFFFSLPGGADGEPSVLPPYVSFTVDLDWGSFLVYCCLIESPSESLESPFSVCVYITYVRFLMEIFSPHSVKEVCFLGPRNPSFHLSLVFFFCWLCSTRPPLPRGFSSWLQASPSNPPIAPYYRALYKWLFPSFCGLCFSFIVVLVPLRSLLGLPPRLHFPFSK